MKITNNIVIVLAITLLIFCQENTKQESSIDSLEKQDFASIKIGNKLWMAENLNVEVPGSWCYENESTNCAQFGRLYTWEAAKNVCPKGWHIPSANDWKELIEFLGGKEIAGLKLKANGQSGFNALMGGIRYSSFNGWFNAKVEAGYFWSSTEFDTTNQFAIGIDSASSEIHFVGDKNNCACSVRCIKD